MSRLVYQYIFENGLNIYGWSEEVREDYGLGAGQTWVKPPACTEKEIPIFDEISNAWTVVPDYRGLSGWLDGLPYEIESAGSLPDGFSFEPPQKPLSEVKAEKLQAIDRQTSTDITAGFDYEIDGEPLHFSYDLNDQQNFADTANMAQLFQAGVPGIPSEIRWNGWRIMEDGSRQLKGVVLNVEAFLNLYTRGALTHKAACMTVGTERKKALEVAQTLDEVEAA